MLIASYLFSDPSMARNPQFRPGKSMSVLNFGPMSVSCTRTLRLLYEPAYVSEGDKNVLKYSCEGLCLKISAFDASTSM